MKYLALIALVSQANAVPVVGGITKEIACKDEADQLAALWGGESLSTSLVIEDCVTDAADPYKCTIMMPLGVITAADWADTAAQCAALFDTEAGDRKCVSANYDGAGAGTCEAYTTSA